LNPQTCILVQKHHPFTGKLKSETPGDSKSTYLHWEEFSAPFHPENVYFSSETSSLHCKPKLRREQTTLTLLLKRKEAENLRLSATT